MSSIIYSLVFGDNQVIADHTNEKFVGNFRDTSLKLIEKIIASKKKSDKASFTMQGHTFNFKLINNVWFMCMADESYGKQMPFIYIQSLSELFFKNPQNPDFPTALRSLMRKFSSTDDGDISDNLDSLASLGDITQDIPAPASIDSFPSTSSHVQFREELEEVKEHVVTSTNTLKILLTLFTLFMIYFIVASFCGMNLDHCF